MGPCEVLAAAPVLRLPNALSTIACVQRCMFRTHVVMWAVACLARGCARRVQVCDPKPNPLQAGACGFMCAATCGGKACCWMPVSLGGLRRALLLPSHCMGPQAVVQ